MERIQYEGQLLPLLPPKDGGRGGNNAAKAASSDDFSGLRSTIHLAVGAQVMLTVNLSARVGLCNGAVGFVTDVIYGTHTPPNLPVAVMVHFKDYVGPSFHGLNSHVPICPITVSCNISNTHCERTQLPLRLARSMTIHKSQGLTLKKVWVDIGKSERVSGLSYVALSRVKQMSDMIIEPMSFQRLQSVTNSRNFSLRLKEENRLQFLADKTCKSSG